MNLVLFGPPGVGKGTQGMRLAQEEGLAHLATGDILRAAVRDGTEYGKRAKAFMDGGKLVPDEIVVGMIEERITGNGDAGFLLDGFPRNVAQARALEAMLDGHGMHLDRVVFMHAPEDALIERLSGRLICRACGFSFHRQYSPPRVAGRCDRCGGELYQRDDDRAEVIAERLKVYRAQTEPLLAYYRDAPGFRQVDAAGEMQAVFADLKQAVED